MSSLHFRLFSVSNEMREVPVPSMSDSISEGTIVEWIKQPGDAVAEDEVVVVLETDKVSVDGAGGVNMTPEVKTETKSETTSATLDGKEMMISVPSMVDSISEGTIVNWMKKSGDYVAEDDVVVVLETDKVSVDVRAPKSGTITNTLASVDETVKIGESLFQMVTDGDAPAAAATSTSDTAASMTTSTSAAISKRAAIPKVVAIPEPANTNNSPLLATHERASRRETMSRMRLRTAERLKESQNTAASLTTFQEVDMSNLMGLRKQYKDAFEAKHGVKLGFMSAFVKASASALMEVPGVNAMIDDEHQEIVYRDYVDMSVAVSTPKGLVTPVLKNTESMSFADVEKGLAELAARARDGKLTLEEMTGGNFTISNGGVFGSLMGTPIINLPQSGILGMHGTKMRPVVVDGEVVARPMMYLALTYDHRLVDGREGVTCLKAIADKIENPERLLLDI
ncbi:unnamed protein product [Peronospora destructor]|uniref:dihydrolipoyllysine-residue succinyltransferase n=1 Tax=Peronospora destructor TaxID=86335 RepID=A0AAV0T2D0_9STRA|nr:unnamed protein product [Peronospora destructor]